MAEADVIEKEPIAETPVETPAETPAVEKPVEAGTEGDKPAAEGGKPEDKGGEGDKPSIPDNWRELMAGDNEDALKLLNRYGSLSGVGKALLEKDKMIREGKIGGKAMEKPDPKDEKAMAEWRKANGVPDDPTGYKLPDAVTKSLTDADKPVLAAFTEFAHAKGARPDVVEIAAEWYMEQATAQAEQMAIEDKTHKEACEDALRDPVNGWVAAEYKGNLNLAKRFLEDSPLGPDGWAGLRGSDGRMLGSNPDFLKWAADMAREKYGDATFANSDVAMKHENRMKEIERIRDTDFATYERDYAKEYNALLKKELERKR